MRVLTYNILKGGEDRLPLIIDVIRAQHPDVVALQEADRTGTTDALAAALGMQVVYGEGPTRYTSA
ncbi:MAG TPA: endonuclease/exonuclease/phosphatase family protein, partial [Ktedonobacterales bacterium]